LEVIAAQAIAADRYLPAKKKQFEQLEAGKKF